MINSPYLPEYDLLILLIYDFSKFWKQFTAMLTDKSII